MMRRKAKLLGKLKRAICACNAAQDTSKLKVLLNREVFRKPVEGTNMASIPGGRVQAIYKLGGRGESLVLASMELWITEPIKKGKKR
jgi:hypothetical protein